MFEYKDMCKNYTCYSSGSARNLFLKIYSPHMINVDDCLPGNHIIHESCQSALYDKAAAAVSSSNNAHATPHKQSGNTVKRNSRPNIFVLFNNVSILVTALR